ncbi:radical SAM protein [Archaeoglobus fulgidus]|jgi:wyosine [tRNA(Phe)-imidazoG37] synthetase (radical SAM superfamily)|uniref:Uncharacterized protein n=2 Tax=Archaeoglobus fulgidus TaxID=2234 RepID=A0A075WDZ0_ARCFL|nr:radical SAM protein [Archaeoglobus fulgidus]AIG97359.1 hypothetical protein AFULGI_00005510 [Archaeoglobus fulgidus DSM 8774]KUJ93566.1 MAG: hypothetical protein XD40_1200 [Archaeoglobus fulgidus]KUK07173.1 MAG: hypothetical protein XD48_0631 [Archaeoglobus fulgidus]
MVSRLWTKNLGAEISMLKDLGRVAVVTNSSLLFMEDVRLELNLANLVSLKVDAVDELLWRRVNRPHPALKLEDILDGISKFAEDYNGTLITETMLIDGLTTLEEVERIAEFLESVSPDKAYLAIPTRPPAENVRGAEIDFVLEAGRIFKKHVDVELLIEPEKGEFEIKNKEDILAIASVHPIREDILKSYLKKLGLESKNCSMS